MKSYLQVEPADRRDRGQEGSYVAYEWQPM
jgi:hypothetical protein